MQNREYMHERGSTLIYVLVMMVLLTVIGLTLISVSINGMNRTNMREADTKAIYLAEKGIMYFEKDFEKKVIEKAEQSETINIVEIFNSYKDKKVFTETQNIEESYSVQISPQHYEDGTFKLNDDGTVTVIGRGKTYTRTGNEKKEVIKTVQQKLLLDYDIEYNDVAMEFATFPENTMGRDFANTWSTLNLSIAKDAVNIDLLKAYGPNQTFYPVPNDAAVELGVLGSLLGFSIGDGDRFQYLRANPIIAVRKGHLLELGLISNIDITQIDPEPTSTTPTADEQEKQQQDLEENLDTKGEVREAITPKEGTNVQDTAKDLAKSALQVELLKWQPKLKDAEGNVIGLTPTNVVINGSVNVSNLLFMRFNTFRDIAFTQFAVTGDTVITQKKEITWEDGLINDTATRRNFTFNRKDFYEYNPDTKQPLRLLKADAGGLFVQQKLQIGNGTLVEKSEKYRANVGLGGDMFVYDYINPYSSQEEKDQREKNPALLISGVNVTAINAHKLEDEIKKDGSKWVLEEKNGQAYPVSRYYVDGDVVINDACLSGETEENRINIYAKGKIDIHYNGKCETQKVFLHASEGINLHVDSGKTMTINGGIIGKRKIVGGGNVTVNGLNLESLRTEKYSDYTLTPVGKKIVVNK